MATRNSNYQTAFGEALSAQLNASNTTASALAGDIGVSRACMTRMMDGSRYVSAKRANEIAKALNLTEWQTVQLHWAAARDRGYQLEPLDLTKK